VIIDGRMKPVDSPDDSAGEGVELLVASPVSESELEGGSKGQVNIGTELDVVLVSSV